MRKHWGLALLAVGSAALQVHADDTATGSSSSASRVRAVVRLVPGTQESPSRRAEPSLSQDLKSASEEEPARFPAPAIVSPQGELPASGVAGRRALEPHRAGEIATQELSHTTSALSVELTPLDVAAQSKTSRGFVLAVEHQGVGTTDQSRLLLRLPPGVRLARLEPSIGWTQDQQDSGLWTRSLAGFAAGDRREWRGYLDGAEVRGRIEARVESWAEVFDELGELNQVEAATAPQVVSDEVTTDDAGLEPAEGAVSDSQVELRCEGPVRAKLGATLIYTIRILNESDSVLEGVELVPELDSGLYLEGRRHLLISEPLAPGDGATLDVAVRSSEAGEQGMRFELRQGEKTLAEVEHQLQVSDAGLATRLEGAASAVVGTEAAFAIHVEHRGQMALEDVVVTLSLPKGLRVTKVEHEPGYDAELGMMAWRIVRLEPGATVVLQYRAVVEAPGALTQQIDVSHGTSDEVVTTRLATQGRPATSASPRSARAIPLRDPIPRNSNRD